jgi:hypothetical protein
VASNNLLMQNLYIMVSSGGTTLGYAIVGYFDKKSDDKIKSLWKGMADSGVCD